MRHDTINTLPASSHTETSSAQQITHYGKFNLQDEKPATLSVLHSVLLRLLHPQPKSSMRLESRSTLEFSFAKIINNAGLQGAVATFRSSLLFVQETMPGVRSKISGRFIWLIRHPLWVRVEIEVESKAPFMVFAWWCSKCLSVQGGALMLS